MQDTSVFISGGFKAVIEKCDGCDRIVEADNTKFCKAYTDPEAKWRLGLCNFATHVKPDTTTAKIKVNPLKASKRAQAKKK